MALALIALPAWLRVLNGLLPAGLHRSLYGLAILLLGLILHSTVSELKLLGRLTLTAELTLGIAWIVWLRRPERLDLVEDLLQETASASLRLCLCGRRLGRRRTGLLTESTE